MLRSWNFSANSGLRNASRSATPPLAGRRCCWPAAVRRVVRVVELRGLPPFGAPTIEYVRRALAEVDRAAAAIGRCRPWSAACRCSKNAGVPSAGTGVAVRGDEAVAVGVDGVVVDPVAAAVGAGSSGRARGPRRRRRAPCRRPCSGRRRAGRRSRRSRGSAASCWKVGETTAGSSSRTFGRAGSAACAGTSCRVVPSPV